MNVSGNKLSENKWTMTALAVIFGALFLTRGGLASLGPLLRFVLPVLGVVLVLRMIKGRIRSAVDDAVQRQQQQMGQRMGRQPGESADQSAVIDLCPKCGAYMKAGHRCGG